MILRKIVVRVLPARAGDLIHAVRNNVLPQATQVPGMGELIYGFRREGHDTYGLALSAWNDFENILEATSGRPDVVAGGIDLSGFAQLVEISHFELVEPVATAHVNLTGAVVGVVRGTVKENVEAPAVSMVREAWRQIEPAGALGLYIGRRLQAAGSELAIFAVWPNRQVLREFARHRSGGVIRPDFLELLDDFSFHTWDCVTPERLMLRPSGPAMLLVSADGQIVDATSGVERIFGVPGEMLLGTTLARCMAPQESRPWETLLTPNQVVGPVMLAQADGSAVAAYTTAIADTGEPGLIAVLLRLGDDPPVDAAETVAAAFSRPSNELTEA